MQWLSRSILVLTSCALLAVAGVAQQSPGRAPAKSAASSKRFCHTEQGFCFNYPASWVVLGESFGDGIVIAPQQVTERAIWDEVTVAQIVAAPTTGQSVTTIDEVIDTAANNMRAGGRYPETLHRQARTVDGLPAQMIKVRYHDGESGRDWVEELVFIEGPQQEIYSVALKAQPANLSRLEPAFAAILRSWKLSDSANASTQFSAKKPESHASAPSASQH